MVINPLLFQILSVLFFATLIRSVFGFGEALVAVPMLALIMPVTVAAPLAALVSVTVAGILVAKNWSEVHIASAGRLVIATFFGIPLGLLLLTAAAESIVKTALGCVIIGFSTYSLVSRRQPSLKNDGFAWVFGFLAGVLGGAYGMNGPPLVIYGTMRGWSPRHFRATLQGYFLPASLVGSAGYWMAGLWTREVNHLYLISLPLVFLAIFLGSVINRRMPARRFVVYIHAGLIAIGSLLLLQALNPPL